MVSLRRRRLLGLCPGRNSFLAQLPELSEGVNLFQNPIQNAKWCKSGSVDLTHSFNSPHPKAINTNFSEVGTGSSSFKEEQTSKVSGKQTKSRKRNRRRCFVDQGLCPIRGVYFKNRKWQAAIKVNKKQVHLGTVGSQEEAAHLYDRAAFVCGREPNFELSDEEKQELRQFKWDEFLSITRSAASSKNHRRMWLGASVDKIQDPAE